MLVPNSRAGRCPQGSSLICVHPTRSARAQNKAEGGGNEMAPPKDTQTRSRLSIGEDGPSDSALAAARDGRLRRPAAERHAARCASRVLCSGGAPRRYSPSMVWKKKQAVIGSRMTIVFLG